MNQKGVDLTHSGLSYDDVGEGSVTVVFLHGYPFDKTMWRGQLEALKSSFRVIAIDLPGFGASKDPKSVPTMEFYADTLIRLMDDLKIKSVVLCGLSMGGYIALNAQKRFPERFSALILCDSQCHADTLEGKEKRYQAAADIGAGGADVFREGFVQKVFAKQTYDQLPEIVETLRKVVFATSPTRLIAGLRALAERPESCSSLRNITVPTLILCGKEDALTPVSQSEFMHSQIQRSALRVVEDAGHVSNLENPEEFNRHLREFIEELSR